jgi:hypothetical protein
MERIQSKARMVGNESRRQWEELPPHRIIEGGSPVNHTQNVRGEPDSHRSHLETPYSILDEIIPGLDMLEQRIGGRRKKFGQICIEEGEKV